MAGEHDRKGGKRLEWKNDLRIFLMLECSVGPHLLSISGRSSIFPWISANDIKMIVR